ncbi:hypothetical protein, variant [Aphanomyces invadans]|nr:hypothetical protein, variant [Aphanomyces invadans]ETV97360.1 hypothetical protein, variant [Aphanomyces invadans]|eukprot:XP_008874068.1 hypothetical protein, variant [Aphanomyces invadans]
MLMTKAHASNSSTALEATSHWYFFPDWYIFGGLSVVAMATVFGAGNNIGATVREIFQQLGGVGSALLYNMVVFFLLPPQSFSSVAEVERAKLDGTLQAAQHSFSGRSYWIHPRDFYTKLPFIMLFTLIGILLPMETNTRRYMLNNNLFFALTLASPNDFTNPSVLKTPGDVLYYPPNIVANLFVYLLLGVLGAVIANLVLWVPYPMFGIRQLEVHTTTCAASLDDLLDLLVDACCFKTKDVDHLKFLQLKLQRKFDEAVEKHAAMEALLQDVWWEQLVGLHLPLRFRRSSIQPLVALFGAQVENLRAMYQAMELERYEDLHKHFMASLQQDVYSVQVHASQLVHEISALAHHGVIDMQLSGQDPLDRQMETLLKRFHDAQGLIYKAHSPTPRHVEGTMSLHVFVFSLELYCKTLLEFQAKYNATAHHTAQRMVNFTKAKLYSYIDPANYPPAKLLTTFKAWIAILFACLISVYTFGYSPTTPSAVAIVMSSHVGGSFRVTVNRVGGIIAGTIVPSVLLFYICSYTCGQTVLMAAFTYAVVMVWVTMSMFVCFKNGIEAYAGLISAFTSTQVLLKGCDGCERSTVTPISSYSNLAQLSLGVVLFVVVELSVRPHSVISVIRTNVQTQLGLFRQCYQTLVDEAIRHGGGQVGDPKAIQRIVQAQLPSLLLTQASLMAEAAFEPQLWRAPFSNAKYRAVLACCQRLHNHTLVLFHVTQWVRGRQHSVSGLPFAVDGFDPVNTAMNDSFATLHNLFGSSFANMDADQIAMYIQMKEAFRLADKDGSGDVDIAEVKDMLGMIFAESGVTKLDGMDECVNAFMKLVDTDGNDRVTLDEFKLALERGLRLQIAVPTALRQQSSIRTAMATAMPVSTHESKTELRRLTSKKPPPNRICRPRDLLAADEIALPEMAMALRIQFAKWTLHQCESSTPPVETLLLLNCLVSAVSGFATSLAKLEELAAQQ